MTDQELLVAADAAAARAYAPYSNFLVGCAVLISLRVLSPISRPRSITRESHSIDLIGALLVTSGVALGALGLFAVAEDIGHQAGWLVAAMSAVVAGSRST